MMMHRIIAAALVAAATPLAASAETCPTSSDLTKGITLVRFDPYLSWYAKREGASQPIVIEALNPGLGLIGTYRMIFEHGLVPIQKTARLPASIDYDRDTSELVQLPALGEWSAIATSISMNLYGPAAVETSQTLRFLEHDVLEVGGCPYDIWRVHHTTSWQSFGSRTLEKLYAPELGLVIGQSNIDGAGGAINTLVFDQITAE